MAKTRGAARNYIAGVKAAFSSLGTVVPVVAGIAVVFAVLDHTLYGALTKGMTMATRQSQGTLIRVIVGLAVTALVYEIVVGPFVNAIAIYVGRCYTEGTSANLYKAVNFALNRYRRVFLPHAGAQLVIQVGMVVIVPGVLFWMQYAFVDAVACLEDEKWPLARSKKLTRGRRKTIFLVLLPVIILSQLVGFAQLWAIGQGPLWLVALHFAYSFYAFTVWLTFYMLYDERTTPAPPTA